MVRHTSKALIAAACVTFGCTAALAAPDGAASPAPEVSAAPSPLGPLREIGRVHAQTAFCQAVYDRGGLATSAALDNDASLAQTSAYLSHVELDDNALNKPKAVVEMHQTYEALMGRARSAIDVSKSLRKLADDAPTPEQKAALIAYANAIGGALHRQELVAADYLRFAVYVEAHQPVTWQQQEHEQIAASLSPPHPGDYQLHMPTSWQPSDPALGESLAYPQMPGDFNFSQDPRDHVTPRLSDLAKAESAHLTDEHGKVAGDELQAATAVPAAFGPCAPGNTAP